MATTKKNTAEEQIPAGYAYIRAPLARNTEQDFVIGVNGVNTTIPQDGGMHLVREEVAYEYNRSLKAQRAFFDTQDRLHNAAKIV